jgi:hypothetical protein
MPVRKPLQAALLGVAAVAMCFYGVRAARGQEVTQNLTYSRGQSVMPIYEGWHPNPDGTADVWFGYLNQNYQEELDLPVGPANTLTPAPYGPDGNQPTHFLSRRNWWVFSIRVPKDFGDKEIVWTVTSHGQTNRAYGTLKPGYVHDDNGIQREFFNDPPAGGNKPPEIHIEGDNHRSAKAGQPESLTVVATDDGIPRGFGFGGAPPAGAGGGAPGGRGGRSGPPGGGLSGGGRGRGLSPCGSPLPDPSCDAPLNFGVLATARGLRVSCFIYRGPGTSVAFTPRQPKVWEDQRGGSSWGPGYVNPPVPKDNKWLVQANFRQPGNYVVRCQAFDGLAATTQDVAFTVEP